MKLHIFKTKCRKKQAEMLRFSQPVLHRKKHKAPCKKYKPYILKYKALISKYMPCIFCPHKYLMYSNIQEGFKMP